MRLLNTRVHFEQVSLPEGFERLTLAVRLVLDQARTPAEIEPSGSDEADDEIGDLTNSSVGEEVCA